MQKPKLQKQTTRYVAHMNASEYDSLEVTEDEEGRITFQLLEGRWRTKAETVALLEETIDLIEGMK